MSGGDPWTGLTVEDRQFLNRPRIGLVTAAPAESQWPTPAPVWFEATEDGVQYFTSAQFPRTRRLQTTPRASFIAAAEVGEPEHWVAITGPVTVTPEGSIDLMLRLAGRYWDLDDPEKAAIVDGWRQDSNGMRVIIGAEKVTRYTG